MGCMQKVFATEIDVELFRRGRADPRGLRHGAARRATRWPAAPSRSSRRTRDREEPCVNPRFYDWPDAAATAIRAFDLRDHCE